MLFSLQASMTLVERWLDKFSPINTFFGFLFSSIYCIQHCFICRPSDSTVLEDAGIEPRTVATSVLAIRHSNH
jgi:hypothetical protein